MKTEDFKANEYYRHVAMAQVIFIYEIRSTPMDQNSTIIYGLPDPEHRPLGLHEYLESQAGS